MANEPDVQKTKLHLDVGDTMQLQLVPGGVDDRHYVRMIGYMAGKSIVVTTPRVDGATLDIQPGQKFVIRLLSGQSIQGFEAQAICTAEEPYPHMHITYPSTLKSVVMRSSERVSTKLIVSVKNEEPDSAYNNRRSALIADLSTDGALIISKESLGVEGDTIILHARIDVKDLDNYIDIPAIIRRITNITGATGQVPGRFEYGVQFQIVDKNDKLLIYAYVYERITKQGASQINMA